MKTPSGTAFGCDAAGRTTESSVLTGYGLSLAKEDRLLALAAAAAMAVRNARSPADFRRARRSPEWPVLARFAACDRLAVLLPRRAFREAKLGQELRKLST